jgi:hypothetical protein
MRPKIFYLFLILILLTSCSLVSVQSPKYQNLSRSEKKALREADKFLTTLKNNPEYQIITLAVAVDSIEVKDDAKTVEIFFNKYLSFLPMRQDNVDHLYAGFQEELGWKFRHYDLSLYTLDTKIEKLVPNFFREKADYDPSKMPLPNSSDVVPVVRRMDWKADPSQGLKGRNIALWHSHGWYYSNTVDRWEWQRPRLFQTVEDLLPTGFVLPYIVPMLENAGANVFLPRERDWQTNEVVVDNDTSLFNSKYVEYDGEIDKWETADDAGFGLGEAPYETGENPFKFGSCRTIVSSSDSTAKVEWIPEIPEEGEYAVYISYKRGENNVTDAHYAVYHLGGKTEFLVNQQIGGATWIYLGKFKFAAGYNPDFCKVELTNESCTAGKRITADAVRFGGGMGDVARGGHVSHRPRFVEGARYYLQYAGMPDTLIYHVNNDKNDYNDDYTSRGEWVNYLVGAPKGPNINRNVKGLGIPVDLSFSFHTDAGIRNDDKVVGTLSIYSIQDKNDSLVFPDGVSRVANRDLADIIQTQIVSDARAKYDSNWTRRSLYIGNYSEAYRPNVPSMLLELFSHQNFQDMKFGLDPKFRFDVSRSIYKGFLKFLSASYGFDYVVQPLPVTDFQVSFSGQREVTLKWEEQIDNLEPTAKAEKYIVYTRINDLDFDNGQVVESNSCVMKDLNPGVQYSFKISAVNAGGESFPSEILSACWVDDASETVLIVNNFDRITAAATIDNGDFKGFANFIDEGVPDRYDLGFTGEQHDFSRSSAWLTNDFPGWGASYGDYETRVIAGNSFDYPYIHGKSIAKNGYSYVSASDEAVEKGTVKLSDYKMVDMIYGEERTTKYSAQKDSLIYQVFSPEMKTIVTDYLNGGGNIFMSGAYLGSDLFRTPKDSTDDATFAREVLKYNFVTDHAARGDKFFLTGEEYKEFAYNNQYSNQIYKVEAPDAIGPAAKSGAKTFLRFRDNAFSAGIYYQSEEYNLVLMTIPFESILQQKDRDDLMKIILGKINMEN